MTAQGPTLPATTATSHTCDCSGADFTGDNCDVSAASELALILGAGLGAVRCSIMVVLGLGLGIGATKDVQAHDFGIVIELDVGPAEVGQADVGVHRAQLVSAVAKHVPRLASELAQARISPLELGPLKLLLVIPKPTATLGVATFGVY